MKIVFIQTGGTIDKDYPRKQGGYAFEIGPPAVSRIIEKLNPTFRYEIRPILQKDSLDLTVEDRQTLRKVCMEEACPYLILTHGTDTLKETAYTLTGIPGKTIILTGSMRPERFSNSDAPIQIGMAIGAIEYLSEGVYIAMHGRVMPANKCQRNAETGQYILQ